MRVVKLFPEIIQSYLRENSPVKQFIDSYDKFVDSSLQEIVDAQKVIEPQIEGVVVKLGKVSVGRPIVIEYDGSRRELWPMEARTRDLTYSAPIYLEMTLVVNGVEKKTENVYIGELPVMVKSKHCYLRGMSEEELVQAGEDPLDPGGYFIINGTEKSLMTLEDLAPNRILVSREKDKEMTQTKVFSTRLGFRGRCTVDRMKDGRFFVTMPSYSKPLELVLVLKALGLDKEEKILEAFPEQSEVRNDVLLNLEADEAKGRRDALEAIGKRAAPGQPLDYQLKRAELLLDRYLLPHIGVEERDRLAKAYFLCRMAERTVYVAYRLRAVEDKDHYANKRLKISGKLMEELFRYAFQFLVKDITYQMERANVRGRKISMFAIVRPDALSDRIKYSMATGNWVGGHTGVCQPLDRYNYISAVSFIRRVTSPLAKKHPHHKARDLHGTHYGGLDPNETPEGPNCVAPDTQILLSDFTGVSIGEYEGLAKRKVLSCDWKEKRLAESDIVRYIKQEPKTTLRVVTKETGRTVVATPDHPFYSDEGKMPLSQLAVGNRVAVMPVIPVPFEEPRDSVILDEAGVRAACPPKTDADYVVSELVKRNLLPLKENDSRLPVLARLVGHLFGDGTLSYSMKKHKSSVAIVFTGDEEGLKEVSKDVEFLGFSISRVTRHSAVSRLEDGKTISGTTLRCASYSKPLWVLLAALRAPVGDKAVVKTRVPKWLMKQRLAVAREFLSAYFGSEMTAPKVDDRNGKIFLQPAFSLNKVNAGNGLEFVEDIGELLKKFGVEIAHVKIVDGVVRKDGSATKKIKAMLKSTPENLVSLYGKIGFAYCPRRRMLARFAAEYLLTKQHMLARRMEVMEKAVALHSQGMRVSQIVAALGGACRSHDVANWIKAVRKSGKRVRVSEKDFPRFREWVAEHGLSEEGLVWETIESIEPVECSDVRDVTTLQNHHNFFANGFLTGNCGLVKNLALFCEITTGTPEEPVEAALKKMGVVMRA